MSFHTILYHTIANGPSDIEEEVIEVPKGIYSQGSSEDGVQGVYGPHGALGGVVVVVEEVVVVAVVEEVMARVLAVQFVVMESERNQVFF